MALPSVFLFVQKHMVCVQNIIILDIGLENVSNCVDKTYIHNSNNDSHWQNKKTFYVMPKFLKQNKKIKWRLKMLQGAIYWTVNIFSSLSIVILFCFNNGTIFHAKVNLNENVKHEAQNCVCLSIIQNRKIQFVDSKQHIFQLNDSKWR